MEPANIYLPHSLFSTSKTIFQLLFQFFLLNGICFWVIALKSSWQVGRLPGCQQTSQLTRSLAVPTQYSRVTCCIIYFTLRYSSYKLLFLWSNQITDFQLNSPFKISNAQTKYSKPSQLLEEWHAMPRYAYRFCDRKCLESMVENKDKCI